MQDRYGVEEGWGMNGDNSIVDIVLCKGNDTEICYTDLTSNMFQYDGIIFL